MVRVLAVNNYPTEERFEKLRSCLLLGGAEVEVADWRGCSAGVFDRYDGVALSGSPDMLSEAAAREKYAAETRAIAEARVPVLGVCFGHQMMSLAFGGDVVKDSRHVLDFVKTSFAGEEPLFEGLGASALLLESRHDVVPAVPPGFRLLASSETTKVAAMRHRDRPLYGVQSHPERYSKENPGGRRLVQNFVTMLRR